MINRKDFLAYPYSIPDRKFESTMIDRKYFLRGGIFSHE